MIDREPAVAGQFYPANPIILRGEINSYAKKTGSLLNARAVVVPHAGYIYSGAATGAVFSAVQLPSRLILLGPNHSGKGAPMALAPAGSWSTPLGSVAIDSILNSTLLAECPALREDSAAHRKEHSLEVQIPFLQVLQPDFRFSAICIKTIDYSALNALGHAMARTIQQCQDPVLMVASSDMTHYQSAETAAEMDKQAIDRIVAVDPLGLYQVVLEKNITMCGFAPAVAVLIACRDLGAAAGQLLTYTNSGEASGDYNRVVAYAGLAII